jgi:hypothetical protein
VSLGSGDVPAGGLGRRHGLLGRLLEDGRLLAAPDLLAHARVKRVDVHDGDRLRFRAGRGGSGAWCSTQRSHTAATARTSTCFASGLSARKRAAAFTTARSVMTWLRSLGAAGSGSAG